MNPEALWDKDLALSKLDLAEIESRIGAQGEAYELLGGGLANSNIRIGKARVLRIYRRDPGAMLKERTLILRPWQFVKVPDIFATGHDYLLMSHVEHRPLEGSAEEGEALGCALSEIHATGYDSAGFIGSDLKLSEPWDDLISALGAYMVACFEKLDPANFGGLGKAACAAFERNSEELREAAGPSVLLHGDFKLSNLHKTESELPLVLDWEFSYAGSALSDIGQLMRWNPPKAFVEGFEAAYQGTRLRADWRRLARLMDLPNLAGLLINTTAGSIRDRDISVLMKEIIQ